MAGAGLEVWRLRERIRDVAKHFRPNIATVSQSGDGVGDPVSVSVGSDPNEEAGSELSPYMPHGSREEEDDKGEPRGSPLEAGGHRDHTQRPGIRGCHQAENGGVEAGDCRVRDNHASLKCDTAI